MIASAAISLTTIFQSYSVEPAINNPDQGNLENKITAIEEENQEYEIINQPIDLDREYWSKAKIIHIPESHLGNALSMYSSGGHAIYRPVPETFPEYERQKIPIDAHESGHGQGLIDEKKTDDYAASRTGQTLRIPIIYPDRERRRAA
jgi:hypothetical protein